MASEIQAIPPIPEGLIEAAQRGRLIPFIGAGASRIAGCPSWPEFADKALYSVVKQGGLSHSQIAQLSHLGPRVKLSIARSIALEHGLIIDYSDILLPVNGGYENSSGRRLYSSLGKLGKTFVTTNYDRWLDNIPNEQLQNIQPQADQMPMAIQVDRKVIHKIDDFLPAALDRPDTVIHLHGSILDDAWSLPS